MRTILPTLCLAVAVLSGCSSNPKPATPDSTSTSGSEGSSPMQLVQQAAVGIGDPEIEISNTSDRPIALDLNGPQTVHLDIPGNEARRLKLAPGTYVLHTMIDGIPSDHPATFARDTRYTLTWKMILEVDDPHYVGKGYECFEMKTKPSYLVCNRRKEACAASRKLAPPGAKLGECAHHDTMYFFRAKTHEGQPAALFEPTAAECESVRKLSIDQKILVDASACEQGN